MTLMNKSGENIKRGQISLMPFINDFEFNFIFDYDLFSLI